MPSTTLKAAVITAVACTTTGIAHAGLIIQGNIPSSAEQTGATYFAELNYAHTSGNQGLLSIELTNNTPASVGGFLTAFVFNFTSTDPNATINLASTTRPAFTNASGASAAPFGSFQAGAGIGGTFLGGGSPHGGIAVGATEAFAFNVNAGDAAILTADSFADGGFEHNFIVRFRGLADGGSDKVPGDVSRIPAPGTLSLCAAALCIGTRRRR